MDNVIPVIEKISIAAAAGHVGLVIGTGLTVVFGLVLAIVALFKLFAWIVGAVGGKAIGRAAMNIGVHAANSQIDKGVWQERRAQNFEQGVLMHQARREIDANYSNKR